ncbi:sodium- and chloride-dependent glycine transporter 2-like isoform X3 [Apis dorsata]|uniref:sodium- and chloride-dependent glycine transporter 2-like isoform X3 n=1 Tax=Apis dorsata TaxID=7462 RepID=UPI0003DF6582|nr:sodium- and chloride-dependent glycine transporter 2-like isoform X3 [Apis dorsata]
MSEARWRHMRRELDGFVMRCYYEMVSTCSIMLFCRLSRYLALYSRLIDAEIGQNATRHLSVTPPRDIFFFAPGSIAAMTEAKEKTCKRKRVSLGVGGALVELEQDPERGSWANPIEFVLSCIGYAVGIGNVWRFPYLVYRNGGGAFIIPFVLMLITMGLPIFFLELAVGQYSGLGPNEAFKRMAPALEGLGYCTLVVILLVMVYYMVIVAWTLFYTFLSFLPKLSWAYCDNDFNTNHCYSGLQEIQCQTDDPETIFYNKSCISASHVCRSFDFEDGNITHCFKAGKVELLRNLYTRILSSEEYFNDYVLGIRGATWEHFGGVRWELLGCLTLAWIICFLCLMRGVQSIGKIVYFTALFPYAMLIALLIRGVTLEGALDGSLWFIMPKWSTLQSTGVWADAASQVFYSLGIGCGSLITLSSYSNFNNNCHRDAIFVTFTNLATSVFAGLVIFSIMGFLARQMGVSVEDVIQSGAGLAFIAYPEAVVRMPLPNVWAVLFFVMLFILGIGSQVVFVHQIYTYEMPRYGKYIFPNWANAIGILIGLSTLAPMPLFFIRRVWKGPRDRSMFRPKKTWGPAVEKSKDTVSTAVSVKVSEPRGNETQENSAV